MDTQQTSHRNLFVTLVLILVCILVPVVGHIILTFMIAKDDMTLPEKLIWLLVVWLLFVWVGPAIYLLVGQRRNRLFGGHALL